jgi:flavin-dependent dehydrogenase
MLNDKVRIFLNDDNKIESEIIVGADGVWSIVAKKSGLRKRGVNFGLCVFQEFELDEKTLDTFFGEKRFGHIHSRFHGLSGYGWVFPKKKHINIGIGEIISRSKKSTNKTNLLKTYKEYIETLKEDNLIPNNIKIDRCKGGALPVFPLEKTYGERVLLIGDAGGFINPLTGEGIYYAMSSGDIAAEVITEALESRKTDEKFLSKYQVKWKKDFGKEIELLYRFAKRQGKKSSEKIFEIGSKDMILSELLLGIVTGQLSIQEYKLKITKRYIYRYIKNFLSNS